VKEHRHDFMKVTYRSSLYPRNPFSLFNTYIRLVDKVFINTYRLIYVNIHHLFMATQLYGNILR